MSKDAQLDPKTIQVANYPSRKLILLKLKSGPMAVTSLQKSVKMSQKAFESHFGQLRDEGLVKAEKETVCLTDKGKEILSYVEKLDQENIDWT
jgi:predicted transcriptional regulator